MLSFNFTFIHIVKHPLDMITEIIDMHSGYNIITLPIDMHLGCHIIAPGY